MEQSKLIFMRKFIHIILTIIVAGLSAVMAHAQVIGAGTYTGDAFLGYASGGNIKLSGDVTVTSQITVNSNLTIDLNGYMLAGNFGDTAPANNYLIRVNTGGVTLNIVNTSSESRTRSIELYNGAIVQIQGAVITNKFNHAIAVTGSSASSRGTCNISNCKIAGCSTSGSGGAINIFTYGGKVTLNNVDVCYNFAAVSGGAIYGLGFELSGSRVHNNVSGSDGGGIYIVTKGVNHNSFPNIISNGSIISNNNAGRDGGGIFCNPNPNNPLEINGSKLSYNFADQNGGGIYCLSTNVSIINNSSIEYNYANSRGGGFYLGRNSNNTGTAKCTCTLTNSSIIHNTALEFGGGGQVGKISGDNASLTITNSTINNNRSILRGAGGVHVTGNSTLTFNSGEISYNQAGEMGGGIHSSRGCTLNMNGGKMQGNIVYGRGGAINLSTGSSLILSGTSIMGNKTFTGYKYTYPGVTPYFDNSTKEFKYSVPSHESLGYDSSIIYKGYGGGVAIDAGACNIKNNSIISGNIASADGGGIALVMIDVQSDAHIPTLIMVNGSISDNQASGNGGGVYIMRNTSSLSGNISATINAGTVSGNKAVLNGGGLFMDTGSQFTMADGVTMSDNKAGNGGSGSGGAVYVSQGTATINGGIFTSNTASVNGGALYVNGNVTVAKGTLNQNIATSNGGALYVQAGTVNMNNIVMNNNSATSDGGGLYLSSGSLTIGNNTNNKIQSNKANNGGGVCVANGTLSLTTCNISNNKATRYGGGVYVANTSVSTIDLGGDGVFEHNTASAGGGLAVGGAITLNFEGSLQNNTASNGGGIYLFKGSASSGAVLNFKDGFIRNNYANGNSGQTGYHGTASSIAGFGGGIFLDQGTTFKTTLGTGATFGFYGNRANRGADDIFANGNGTTVNLPDIGGMVLADFDVPTPELYWVEDYATDDTQYSSGTKVISTTGYTAVRYQSALEAGSVDIGKLEATSYSSYKNKYLCLALGYQLFYVTLQKKGLETGDVAIFDISYKDGGTPVSYRKVKFIGRGVSTPVTIVVALPPNEWTFTEDATWSWKYRIPAPLVKSITTQAEANDPIVFVNELKDSGSGVSTRIHYETFRENRMKL